MNYKKRVLSHMGTFITVTSLAIMFNISLFGNGSQKDFMYALSALLIGNFMYKSNEKY